MVESPKIKINECILKLAKNLRYGDNKSTYEIVISTVSALKEVITNAEWNTAKTLMDIIISSGKYLMEAAPLETSIGNMIRRILQIIREEYSSELKNKPDETDPQESLHKILTSESDINIDFNRTVPSLKSALIEHINEFETELETWYTERKLVLIQY